MTGIFIIKTKQTPTLSKHNCGSNFKRCSVRANSTNSLQTTRLDEFGPYLDVNVNCIRENLKYIAYLQEKFHSA